MLRLGCKGGVPGEELVVGGRAAVSADEGRVCGWPVRWGVGCGTSRSGDGCHPRGNPGGWPSQPVAEGQLPWQQGELRHRGAIPGGGRRLWWAGRVRNVQGNRAATRRAASLRAGGAVRLVGPRDPHIDRSQPVGSVPAGAVRSSGGVWSVWWCAVVRGRVLLRSFWCPRLIASSGAFDESAGWFPGRPGLDVRRRTRGPRCWARDLRSAGVCVASGSSSEGRRGCRGRRSPWSCLRRRCLRGRCGGGARGTGRARRGQGAGPVVTVRERWPPGTASFQCEPVPGVARFRSGGRGRRSRGCRRRGRVRCRGLRGGCAGRDRAGR